MSKTGLHRHGCPECHLAYEDACHQHAVNGKCWSCRTGQEGLYGRMGTYKPRECCFTEARPVRRNRGSGSEVDVYKLSSGCPWWICGACKKTFPFSKPRKELA